MRWHAKAWYINANDAHPVDVFGQQLQRDATGSGYAQINDDDGVVVGWVGLVVDRLADVFKQLAGYQAFRVEGDIADAALGTVKM